ncbi:LuxR family transcriptional regulator [Vibrio hannami]|uniref:LuxR family transcriptional regulator n=1 Tax=Vibrio hannami TaxID=2717094 RepID=UPI0024107B3E|nr:LuxR family transcriptional regulator [Vibrio hannami]MDG3085696.1 LuxR family transcriptional regulator [Vibrio hannami]
MRNMVKYAETLHKSLNANDVEQVLRAVAEHCNLTYYLFGISIPISFSRSHTAIFSNYPVKWRQLYDENNYVELDPTVNHCYSSTRAVIWNELEEKYSSRQEKAFFKKAKSYGLISGLSVPVHGNKSELGIFSLASDRDYDSFNKSELTEILLVSQAVAPIAFSKLIEIENSLLKREEKKLTSRERDVIYWAAEGKTTWEIGYILGCSERTVYFHLNNATKKLGVVNRYQAISKAVLHGYVHPSANRNKS